MTDYKTVFQLAQENGYKFRFYQTPESVVPEGWELYRTSEYSKGKLDVKVRKLYAEDELIKFNEDGYEYQSIFINKDLSKEDLLLELTLIQKWLRDEHNLSVYCDIPIEYYWRWVVHGTGKKAAVYNDSRYKEVKEFDTYEEALLQGIWEALKLLK